MSFAINLKFKVKYYFVCLFRPQPMRSMQILRDRLLVLSFYRTASALNVFDLAHLVKKDANLKPDDQESLLKLPQGVIAFQSNHDRCHSQKLVLYKETGLLCQRLDFSYENLVFALRFSGNEKDEKKVGKRVETQEDKAFLCGFKNRFKLPSYRILPKV